MEKAIWTFWPTQYPTTSSEALLRCSVKHLRLNIFKLNQSFPEQTSSFWSSGQKPWESSLTHIPHVMHQDILPALFLKSLQNPVSLHHSHCYHTGPAPANMHFSNRLCGPCLWPPSLSLIQEARLISVRTWVRQVTPASVQSLPMTLHLTQCEGSYGGL